MIAATTVPPLHTCSQNPTYNATKPCHVQTQYECTIYSNQFHISTAFPMYNSLRVTAENVVARFGFNVTLSTQIGYDM